MTSRLSTLAATFAILATATLTYAASAYQSATVTLPAAPVAAAAAKEVRIVQLQRVVVVAKRSDYIAP